MHILIDFISLQRKNGAAEYLRRIIDELCEQTYKKADFSLYGVYNSKFGIAYDDIQPCEMEKKGVHMVDVANTNLVHIINKYNIDKFFIGCVQELENYEELPDLKCGVIVVVHDLSFEETHRDDIDIYIRVQNKPTISLLNWILFHKKKSRTHTWYMTKTAKLLQNNSKAIIVSVSDYTKQSIQYAYDIPDERIHVLYSPERIYTSSAAQVENPQLSSIISAGTRFMLLLGTQHPLKNTRKAIHAFKRFSQIHPDYYLVTTGKDIPQAFANHISLGFLCDTDLKKVYEHCTALIYPTLFEGFGYPPVEVMRYGKPVLASNIGPVREVLSDAPIYYSPLYETDIYRALIQFVSSDYNQLCQKAIERFKYVNARQQNDLKSLLQLIVS